MADDMLKKAEYLRERADVTYEEAMQFLDKNNGDVIASLVELEKQGRVYAQRVDGDKHTNMHHNEHQAQEVKEKVTSLFKEASKTRIVIEKRKENGDKETIANVSAPMAAGITVVAPYLSLAAGAIALATGHHVKVIKEDC